MKIIEGFQKAGSPKGAISNYQGYHFEEKLDGTRLQIVITKNEFWAYTRRISKESGYYMERTEEMSHLAQDFKKIYDNALDAYLLGPGGDILVLDGEGAHPDRSLGFIPIHSVTHRGELDYFVYDIVHLKNGDIRSRSESHRRNIIEQLCSGCNRVHLTPRHDSPAPFLKEFTWNMPIELICERYIKDDIEGFMIKDPNARYVNDRGKGWLKVKKLGCEDVKAIGYEFGNGKYADTVGCLKIASLDGKRSGTCSGMTDSDRDWFKRHFDGGNGDLMIEIMFQQATDRSWRHPRMKRIIHEGE